ncbi:MAG TPA: hypothetical protein VKB34_22285 [Povalibacter sp.]|nr:hypothetical protein [Povalibacter sp.]
MSSQQDRTADAIADPTRQFATPMDVVRDTQLDIEAKRQILESWKKDAELLSTATNENMGGGETPLPVLQDVNLALEKLEKLSGRVN